MNTTTHPTKPAAADNADFTNLVNLIAMGAEADARLNELENDLNQEWLAIVDARRADYAKLQKAKAFAEEAMQDAAEMNPQWFAKQKTLKTPYGQISFRRSSKLEVKNEEASIILLEQLGQDGLPFLKTEKRLVLEALEKMDDTELERLRIKRVITETFAIKYAKPDLGKAVAAAAKGGES